MRDLIERMGLKHWMYKHPDAIVMNLPIMVLYHAIHPKIIGDKRKVLIKLDSRCLRFEEIRRLIEESWKMFLASFPYV